MKSCPLSSVSACVETYGAWRKFTCGVFVLVITLIDSEKPQMHAAVIIGHQLILQHKHSIVCEKLTLI